MKIDIVPRNCIVAAGILLAVAAVEASLAFLSPAHFQYCPSFFALRGQQEHSGECRQAIKMMKGGEISERSFERLVAAAMRVQRPLQLRGRHVSLSLPVNMTSGGSLAIAGPGLVKGDGQTVFSLGGNRQRLRLTDGLQVVHRESIERRAKRETGAAIFCRGKAKVFIESGCTVSSQAGYGVWMVQKADVSIAGDNTAVVDCGRSGVACFGDGRLRISGGAAISRSAVHGICARGSSTVVLGPHATVADSGVRGVYVYHSASLQVVGPGVVVTGTRERRASAVQVEALRAGDRAGLTVKMGEEAEDKENEDEDGLPLPLLLDLSGNEGLGISVAGCVDCDISKDVRICSHLSAVEQLGGVAADAARAWAEAHPS